MHVLLAVLSFLFSAVALPTLDNFGGRSGGLNPAIPDASHVRVFARRDHEFVPHDLTLRDPDFPGDLVAVHKATNPVTFQIYKNRLWVYRNESAIWPVNFMNATHLPDYPLQMVVGMKMSGSKQGLWSWQDMRLNYDHGAGYHSFYACPTSNGHKSLFMYTTPSVPAECDAITITQPCR